MPRLKAAYVMLFLATASVPSALRAQSTYGAVPGSLNFVTGQADIDGRQINTRLNTGVNAPEQPRQLHIGQTLATANGSADILLAPGALLRLGADTTVQMVAADDHHTEVRLEGGRANVSVNLVRKDDLLLVDMQNGQTQVLSRGLYTFNTATNTMRVFNGEAYAFPGADTTSDVKPVTVKESHEILLGGDRARPAKFDRDMADGDLLPWTGPREAQAVLADSSLRAGGEGFSSGAAYGGEGYGNAGYGGAGGYAGGYGFSGYGDGLYGLDSPYAWGPYGFYGYPFFGVGFGYWGGGFYRGGGYGFGGGYPIRGPGRLGGTGSGYAGRGLTSRGAGSGFSTGHSSFGGGGFGGGGFHGGGGGGHR